MPEPLSPDILWKGIIENLFPDFFAYFWPELVPLVDWTHEAEFLDKELTQLSLSTSTQRRYADKLVKVYLRNGTEQWFLIHVEVQNQPDPAFAERMFTYWYRIHDRYRKQVASLAILADRVPTFRPGDFYLSFGGTELTFSYKAFKILDYQPAEISASGNVFSHALEVVRVHLREREWSDEDLLRTKMSLARRLFAAEFEKEAIRHLINFLHYYVIFKDNYFSIKFDEAMDLLKNEPEPFGLEERIIDFYKRQAVKEGLQEGRKKGRKEGRKEGREEGQNLAQRLMIVNAYKKGLVTDIIADISNTNVEQVEAIIQQWREQGDAMLQIPPITDETEEEE